tara:strand:+ start:73 stop:1293 length:1221 start_codon:yes stop_codon:yes gene_type:complete
MKIIEQLINNKKLPASQTKLQKICCEKFKTNSIPNKKSEIWRLVSKPKFSRFLDYKYCDNYHKPSIPGLSGGQNIIRINIGEHQKLDIKGETWEIKNIEEQDLFNLIKKKIINCDNTEKWSNLLNHSLTNNQNIIGLNISGREIPEIEIISNSKNNHFNSKTIILNVKKSTEVNITQIHLGDDNSSLSTTSYLNIEENSKLNHGIIICGKNKSHVINTLDVIQNKNSEYNLGTLQFSFDFARFEISINQIEGNAKTYIKGMQITKNNEQISTYAKIAFNGPNGFLDQLNKSLADGKSHSVFEGLIIVPQIAQKTDASQLSRNLLLSNYAKIDTKPQLEIIADDVKCMHGATISQLNEDEVFYMRSRGLTLAEASKLQLRSYYQEIISFLPISKKRWDLLNLLLNNK